MSILSRLQDAGKALTGPAPKTIQPLWPQIKNPESKPEPTEDEKAVALMDPVLATKLSVYLVMKKEGLTFDEIKYLASNDSLHLGVGYKEPK